MLSCVAVEVLERVEDFRDSSRPRDYVLLALRDDVNHICLLNNHLADVVTMIKQH